MWCLGEREEAARQKCLPLSGEVSVLASSLNPSVDYRTVSRPEFTRGNDLDVLSDCHLSSDLQSVLAGLAPDVIIDIAGRSLGFWTYQQSQEVSVCAQKKRKRLLIVVFLVCRVEQ